MQRLKHVICRRFGAGTFIINFFNVMGFLGGVPVNTEISAVETSGCDPPEQPARGMAAVFVLWARLSTGAQFNEVAKTTQVRPCENGALNPGVPIPVFANPLEAETPASLRSLGRVRRSFNSGGIRRSHNFPEDVVPDNPYLMNSTLPQFYSRLSLHMEVYDAQTQQNWASLHNDASFYVEEAWNAHGPVLELACGTGRIQLPLAAAGVETHGLDCSDAMLEILRRKKAALSPSLAGRLHLHRGDMADFHLQQRFALILAPFRSFQALLTPERQKDCLCCARRHLRPGGRVILNLFDPRHEYLHSGAQSGFQAARVVRHPVSGHEVRIEALERYNNPVTQVFSERWRFTEFDQFGIKLRQEEEVLSLRWTFRQEFRWLAEISGFVVEAEYSDFDRSAPSYGKEQIWVLKAA